MATKTRQGKAATQNWARANRLSELSGIDSPTCRNYLTTVSEEHKELLDSGADARNKTIREMVEAAQAHTAPPRTNARTSKGDPARPARAGAPAEKISSNKCTSNSLDLLIDIKKLADKHGGLETITEGLAALKKLRD